MALLEAVLFSSLWSFGLGQLTLEQPELSVTGTREKSIIMTCKVFSKDFSKDYIHWYRQKPDQGLEQLLFVSTAPAQNHLGGKKNKLEAKKDAPSSTSTLKISFLEKEDEATYYCAGWLSAHSVGVSWITHTRTTTRSVLTTFSTQAATEVAQLGALPKPPTKENGDIKMKISQHQLSSTRRPDRTVHISCKLSGVPLENAIVHWYQEKEGEPLKRILYGSANSYKLDKPNSRLEMDNRKNGIFYLIINNVVKSDEATYYCARWDLTVFGEGTKLVVIPPDRRLDGDLFPKPTIFFPSVEEVKRHSAGTHLCLLQNFFPDAIKVQWKEKHGNTILESHQGNIIKTNDTYMKFSWLTLTKKAMEKEHVCIVKHENNKGGRDQEILFSPVNKEVATRACMKKESDTLQLQFASTSAYYTYLLLLLKSMIYFSIIAFCVFWRTGIFRDGKIF
ncbi:uncharacterized protein LOC128046295 [Budorcas taxicolor]|uniref:uncharacterized protein LOC128046295 n=1 Tax=Budorcas taxicolor TaxID=37181 RepID=UPI00228370C4|nr:uncharacterized protein LOC128046295 [Budorcas taxicolor]